MHPYLRLVRAGNVLISLVGTVVAGLAAGGAGFDLPLRVALDLGLAAVSTACITAAGNVLNDVLDLESDRLNHPDRPLVTGAIAPATARGLVLGLFAIGILVAVPVLLVEPLLGIVLAGAVAALLAYEFRFKSEGLSGNLLVGALTGAVFLYGGAAVGALGPVLAFAGLALLATLSREVIKDMEDAGGDVDRRTLPRVHGLPAAALVARAAVIAAILLSPLPALTFLAGHALVAGIYLAVVAVADAGFIASVFWLPDRLHREQSLSKGAMTIALLAFLSTVLR